MRYEVIIEGQNPLIEEEIDVNVNGTKLKCFMPYGTDFLLKKAEDIIWKLKDDDKEMVAMLEKSLKDH